MGRGKVASEIDLFWALQDDGWERDSRIMAWIYNLNQTVGNLFSGNAKYKSPDDFNDSLKAPSDSPEAIEDDYPWAPAPEEASDDK